jgi:hypothetical protein
MKPTKGIIAFDDSRPHLCVVTFGDEVDDRDVLSLFERTLEVFRQRKRVVLLVDTANSHLSAGQRKLMVSEMRAHEEEFRRWVACSGIVISSALARGTLTALMWMTTPPYEQKVFATLDAAMVWAEKRVTELERQHAERWVATHR